MSVNTIDIIFDSIGFNDKYTRKILVYMIHLYLIHFEELVYRKIKLYLLVSYR